MATWMFADEELARLRGFPEVGREELFRFFTLSPADVVFVAPVRGRGPAGFVGGVVHVAVVGVRAGQGGGRAAGSGGAVGGAVER